MSEFKENTKYVHFSPKSRQYIDFIGLQSQRIDFWCYFNDLTNIWHILTAYDVINDVILCQISRNIQNLEIFSPKNQQYIDFIGFQPQRIDFFGLF